MVQNFVQEIENTIQQFLDGVHTVIPGVIMAFDPAKCTATVELKGLFKKPDGQTIPFPPAAFVPVVFPQVSNQEITIVYPIKPGDGCLVIFAEQSLEAWKAGGASNLDLKHDLSNAIAIPGLFRTPNKTMQEAVAQDAIMLVNQSTKVIVKNQKVEVETQEVEVRASQKVTVQSSQVEIISPKVHITGETTIDKELYVQGIAFTPHVHPDVAPGGATSGPPQ